MKLKLAYLLLFIMALTKISAQEENPFISYDVPSQNLLKFNRFLINPTFSTVREDLSYINLLHRNQSVSFDDNNQLYFLSYSGRINDRSGLGLSLYTQREGVVSNYGILANYAYGVKLSDKSNFTFGANLSYYSSGLDQNRANPIELDPLLSGFQDSSLLSFQPGFNISYDQFDFGVFAENLFDYNLKTSQSITEFKDKTFSAHLQYTYELENNSGVFENSRLMPLARVRQVGQEDIVLGGNLIFDLPKLGWIQAGYDSFYGASAGIGFNLGKRLSLGYTMEKGLSNSFDNFGTTHEISFAYSFTPNLTEDRVMLEENEEAIADTEEEQEAIEESLASDDEEITELKRRLAENDAILAELIFRQDSIETNREKDLERRFEMVMRMVRNETNGDRPDLEEKAREMYFINNDKTALVENVEKPSPTEYKPIVRKKTQADVFIQEAKRNNVKGQKFRDLEGVENGYYVVANVYKGKHYLNKFIDNLNNQGLSADYIDNPKNGLKYVYLKRYDTWKEALAAHKSGLNGTYNGELWVMNVDNRYTNEAYAENANKISKKSSEYDSDVLQKNVVVRDNVKGGEPKSKSQFIQGVGSAYYIIANVFANPRNANRFVKLLNSQGLSASYFINPVNNYRYVYLKRHESWNNALISYYSKLNNAYDDKMWIMRVTPNLIT
ncbi:type IX secretion system membrane protein PorP/SprF [uncultured Eudoraea sp.]|uniref:PorP/SprF family type IX secretion system membrane protein n=2 Tax=Eudoraea TaxID=446680 RepID=UPI0026145163|nr:type IX secretion system membrane protein PorP/SprF [uncultured Eudoraea sp.]